MKSDTLAFLVPRVTVESRREAVWAVFAYAISIDSFAVQQMWTIAHETLNSQTAASYSLVC